MSSPEQLPHGLIGLSHARELLNNADDPLLKFELTRPEYISEALRTPDLTVEGSDHCVNLVKEDVLDRLAKDGYQNITIIRGDPIVSVGDNFDKLRFPATNASRSSTYTRYVDENHVLRTHTSALMPSVLETLAESTGNYDDITFALPGLVFRRDVTDRTHLGVFHQLDVWRVVRNDVVGAMGVDNLHQFANSVLEAAVPGAVLKLYPTEHPYTTNGIEAYAAIGGELEVFEAGLIHPEVLASCGLDPSKYSGLALGMGLDRLVMVRKGLPDIRLLRAENPAIASQMYDLQPYAHHSNQPEISRDLSYCVPAGTSVEDICEGLREAFGPHAPLVEEVVLLSTTGYNDAHSIARERLGMQPNQENVLVRVTLRHPDRTLTRKDANTLYSTVYPQIHQGAQAGYVI